MSQLGVSDLLTVEQAIQIIDSVPLSPRILQSALQDAQGLRLASDIIADRDYPPFDKSLMDGYAVRSADVSATPAVLKVMGEIAAGSAPGRGIEAGETMAIMTGAALPPGADGIVPVEHVERAAGAGEVIRVISAPSPQRYIARAGSDVRCGTVVLPKGTRLEAAQLAAAATVGAAVVEVFAAPRVGVLCTGDEVVPFDATPDAHHIRNSNGILLSGLLRRMGCRVVDLGLVPDRPERIRRELIKGMQLDALFVTGGMSMGRYDYVPQVLRELEVELKITKLRIKPGKPFVFGVGERRVLMKVLEERQTEMQGAFGEIGILGPAEGACCVFGLPGNPVSGFACMVRLASRLLTRLAGGTVEERWLPGQMLSELPANGDREFYQPVLLEYPSPGFGEPCRVGVRPLAYKGSADLFTLAKANGLLVRAAGEPSLPEGARVRVMAV